MLRSLFATACVRKRLFVNCSLIICTYFMIDCVRADWLHVHLDTWHGNYSMQDAKHSYMHVVPETVEESCTLA